MVDFKANSDTDSMDLVRDTDDQLLHPVRQELISYKIFLKCSKLVKWRGRVTQQILPGPKQAVCRREQGGPAEGWTDSPI